MLQWLITQKTEDRIELITRAMLETMVKRQLTWPFTSVSASQWEILLGHKSNRCFGCFPCTVHFYVPSCLILRLRAPPTPQNTIYTELSPSLLLTRIPILHNHTPTHPRTNTNAPPDQCHRITNHRRPIVAPCASLITENRPFITRHFLVGPRTRPDTPIRRPKGQVWTSTILITTTCITLTIPPKRSKALRARIWSSRIRKPRDRRWPTKVQITISNQHLLRFSFASPSSSISARTQLIVVFPCPE